MNFAELRFWEYLLSGLALLLGLRFIFARIVPTRLELFDKVGLLSLGLFLLLCVSWVTFAIFLAVAIGTYVGLYWIQKYHAEHARKYLLVLIPIQLAPLFYYKYAHFIGNIVLGVHLDTLRNLVIPVGISFYTFQKVAFVVDTLVFRHPRPGFLNYMNFAGFFPQIVAGPIERRADLLPQMESFRFRWLPNEINEGITWMAVGFFFKCCLADNLANYFSRGLASNPYFVWMTNLLFGLRIYYDFAGYSLIAVGIARCFGIRLTLNFLSPYCSTSIGEFWRRWHITLSQWFRDYLYVPLGGSRVRYWALNVALVFLVSGIWHGAGWNFLLWGALHGGFLIINRLLGRLTLPNVLGWLGTMIASFYAWLCFYEVNTTALLAKMKLLLTPGAYRRQALMEALRAWGTGDQMVVGGLLLLTIATLIVEWLSVRRKNEPYYYLRRRWMPAVLIVLTIMLAPGKNNGFIYFAF
ncbi:MAG: MBOAT family protein [Verrucomicrobiota bacterium]|nr:MBOAT family protein [Verrucomicrobiota bacterium]